MWIRTGPQEVIDNLAGAGGGGMHLDGMGSSGMTFDGEVARNQAGGAGAGIFLTSHDLDFSGELSDNLGAASSDGVGLYGLGASVTLADTVVSGHAGADGAGIHLGTGSDLTLVRYLRDNRATGSGGALFLLGSLTSQDSLFEDTAGAAGGGPGSTAASSAWTPCSSGPTLAAAPMAAVDSIRAGSLSAVDTAFLDNVSGYGGGLALLGNGTENHDIRGTWFVRNEAAADGGGLFLTDAASTLLAASLFRIIPPQSVEAVPFSTTSTRSSSAGRTGFATRSTWVAGCPPPGLEGAGRSTTASRATAHRAQAAPATERPEAPTRSRMSVSTRTRGMDLSSRGWPLASSGSSTSMPPPTPGAGIAVTTSPLFHLVLHRGLQRNRGFHRRVQPLHLRSCLHGPQVTAMRPTGAAPFRPSPGRMATSTATPSTPI